MLMAVWPCKEKIMKRRVVVTGLGVLTPIGNNVKDSWQGILNHQCGIDFIQKFDTTHMKVKVAGELKNFEATDYLDKKDIRKMDPFIQYGLIASYEAIKDAKLDIETMDHDRFGVVVSSGIGVKLIDKDRDQCERLNESIPDAMIIHGNGNDHDMLLEEGLTDVDAFIALTNHDEENMFLSLYAQSQSDAKLVTKVQKLNYDAMIERLDLGSMIYPEYLTAQYIIQYVRARQNSIGSNIENLYKLMDGRAEALEFHIQKGSPVIGRPIKDLLLIDNLLICSIYRKGKPMIPNGQDHMEEDDLVVVVTTKKGLHDVKDILKRG